MIAYCTQNCKLSLDLLLTYIDKAYRLTVRPWAAAPGLASERDPRSCIVLQRTQDREGRRRTDRRPARRSCPPRPRGSGLGGLTEAGADDRRPAAALRLSLPDPGLSRHHLFRERRRIRQGVGARNAARQISVVESPPATGRRRRARPWWGSARSRASRAVETGPEP